MAHGSVSVSFVSDPSTPILLYSRRSWMLRPVLDGDNHVGRRIDSSELQLALTCCLT
jgi:hypothetical protein